MRFNVPSVGPQIEVSHEPYFSAAGLSGSRATGIRWRARLHETVYHLTHNHQYACRRRAYRVGSQRFRLTATRCQSDRSDSATCCGRNGLGSCSSTSGDPFQNHRPPPLESHPDFVLIQVLSGQTLRHRQTKGAATAMFNLQPPRHISTLHSWRPKASWRRVAGRSDGNSSWRWLTVPAGRLEEVLTSRRHLHERLR